MRRLVSGPCELPGAGWSGHATRLERLLLHARRSDGAGPDPGGGRPAGLLEPARPRPRPARLLRLPRLGRPHRDLADAATATAVLLVVLVPGPRRLLRPVWLLCLAILGLFTVGLFSRVTGVLAWVIIVSTVRRRADRAVRIRPDPLDPGALPGGHVRQRPGRLARSLLPAVASTHGRGPIVPSRGLTGGRRVTAREPGIPHPTISANLALRLIQLHLVFIYAMAGLAKVQGPSWWNGMALWGTMTAGEFVTRDFTALADWPSVLNFLTHASLAFELLLSRS